MVSCLLPFFDANSEFVASISFYIIFFWFSRNKYLLFLVRAYVFVCDGYMVQVYRAVPFFHKNKKNLSKMILHFAYRYRTVYFTFS